MTQTVAKLNPYMGYIRIKENSYTGREITDINPHLCYQIIQMYNNDYFDKDDYYHGLKNLLTIIDKEPEGREQFLDKIVNNFFDIYEKNKDNGRFTAELQTRYLKLFDLNNANQERLGLLATATQNSVMLEILESKNYQFSQKQYLFSLVCGNPISYNKTLTYGYDLEYALSFTLFNQRPESFQVILEQINLEEIDKIRSFIISQKEEPSIHLSIASKVVKESNFLKGMEMIDKYEEFLIIEKNLSGKTSNCPKLKI